MCVNVCVCETLCVFAGMRASFEPKQTQTDTLQPARQFSFSNACFVTLPKGFALEFCYPALEFCTLPWSCIAPPCYLALGFVTLADLTYLAY